MSFPYILSIDAGSSSCKIGVFDTRGTCIDIIRISTSVSASEQGSAIREYNPEVWWDAAVTGIRSILMRTNVRPEEIKAVGLTGQIGTHILLGRDGHILLPAISWQDGRAAAEAAWLAENYPY